MKLLLDACVWPGAASELAAHGHDVVWAGDWQSLGDDEILAIALNEGRVLVTIDKDFGPPAINPKR
jgi:predicted nuclease of predicted toxin-antitoxin system